ncbi:MAG: MSMEG_0568 family radical SAM protein [Candidatus Methanofastidiosa archaeon]|nr:MSMEG_0568 family radical SAM protein [Candidatus Methanofastidiosa archaeon]
MYTTRELKVLLQSRGVVLPGEERGRKGGAGPAAGKSLIFGGTVANVPTQSDFVASSPFSVRSRDEGFWIYEHEAPLVPVTFPHTPHFYAKRTSDGTPMHKVALLHGASCLASTVCQRCVYYGTPHACSFCGIELSLESGATIEEKSPAQLAEVAVAAKEEHAVTHVTLTSGTQRGRDRGLGKLLAAAAAIKDASGLPVHVQTEPLPELSLFDELPGHGVDTLGIHIESVDDAVLAAHAPIKARLGFTRFLAAWEKGVEVLGANQVDSFIIAGLGEDPDLTLRRLRQMIEAGAYPFIVPLRPIPGTRLGSWLPPEPDYVRSLLEMTVPMLSDAHLSWKRSKAGCLRCRACSALPDFEQA